MKMNNTLLKLYVKMQNLMMREEGQDLVEYALVVTVLALGATATMSTLATTISGAFTIIGNKMTAAGL
jgi:pilus assembly protein Flp/PilA